MSPENLAAEAGKSYQPLTPVEAARIEQAIPSEAPAKPKQPRKLLVFFKAEGWVHDSIPDGNEAFRRLGEKTGAYEATLSDDMASFEPQSLQRFDAVLFQNTTQLKFTNAAHRGALLDFLAEGKGLIGIHSGLDNFLDWPEMQARLGGVFHSHPWTAQDVVAVKLDDPAHPLNQPFHGRGFWVRDEIYQIIGPYRRERQRVLLSLDMSKPENRRDAVKFKIVRTDDDFPISWLKEEGATRVFYSSLGHNKAIFATPEILRHFLAGVQFALGDLPADAVPTAKLETPVTPALAPEKPEPLLP